MWSLGLKTKTLGCDIHALDEVDSTNTVASRMAAEGAREGTVVVSECQTAGRGRFGRRWESPPGVNIYMSVILRPEFQPVDAPLVTLAASVALVRALRGLYGLPAAIKWPNDVLINGKKMSGILTEMSAGHGRVRHVILGMGIDVNMKKESFPEDIREISTSVMLELGRDVDRAELLRRSLEELEPVYGLLVKGEKTRILDSWRELSCTLGRRVKVSALSGDIYGTARDIDDCGSLMLEKEGGGTETITSGDVWFLPPPP